MNTETKWTEKPALQAEIPERFLRYGAPEMLAEGSTGTVFRLKPKEYVVKVIACGRDENRQRAAVHEIDILKRLERLPGIVALEDCQTVRGEQGLSFCLLEEYHEPLLTRLERRPMSEEEICRLGIDLCGIMAACRDRDVYHLDVQPKNIFCGDDGHFLLGDFSAALRTKELKDGQHHGTLAYMAPEGYRDKSYGEGSEIYSLGLVLYCLLNGGRLPLTERYRGEEAVYQRLRGMPFAVPETISSLRKCVEKACAERPQERFLRFEEMQAALEQAERDCRQAFAAGMSGTAFPVGSGLPTQAEGFAMFEAEPFASTCMQMGEATAGFESFAEPGHAFNAPPPSMPSPVSDTVRPWAVSPGPPTAEPEIDWSSPTPPPFVPAPPPPAAAPAPSMPSPQPPSPSSAGGRGGLFHGLLGRRRKEAASDLAPSQAKPVPLAPGPPEAAPLPTLPLAPGADVSSGTPFSGTEPAAPRVSEVQFSALFPRRFLRGEYAILEMYMYEELYRRVVDEAIAMAEGGVRESRSGVLGVSENTRVSVRLSSTDPGVEIDGNDEIQIWRGKYIKFDFSVFVPESCARRQVMFTALVSFDGVPATRLRFAADCSSLRQQKLELIRSDVLSAFVSYASQDRSRVASIIQGMKKIRPEMDIFFDVDNLRSGEYWENALRAEIERRDVLFLCWSRAARESSWVDKEWHFALENKGLDAIEPVPIEPPELCPPPKELEKKSFNDRQLLFIRD